MARKKKVQQRIRTSRGRDLERLTSLELQKGGIKDVKREVESKEYSPIVDKLGGNEQRVSDETRVKIDGTTEDLNEKPQLSLDERIRALSPNVIPIYEMTRDGVSLSPEEKERVIHDPNIKGSDLGDAIELGIKSWGDSLFPHKER